MADPTIECSGPVSVRVRDADRAEAWYRDVLGLDFLFRAGDLVFFRCGQVRLMLGPAEAGEFDHAASIIYYRVADLPAAHAAMVARGAAFRDPPHLVAKLPDHELWMAFLDDTEGNVLALMSEVREG